MKIGRREFLGIAGAIAVGSALAVYSKGEASPLIEKPNHLIEGGDEEKTQTPEKSERIEIILTGDVMLGRTVTIESLDEQEDPAYPFRKVASTLRDADLVFVNLENPIYEPCPRETEDLRFCAPYDMVDGLVFSGIDVVTIENNHIRNYGQEGVDQTRDTMKDNGISYTGLGDIAIKKVKGVKFGFLGLEFQTREASEADYDLIKNTKKEVDVLIVGIHWGGQYHDYPTEIQKRDAQRLVEAGADVVAGHGPHWVIDKENINGKPVYYSLGNFVFDQMWSEETRSGLAVKLIFDGSNLVEEEEIPVYMSNWAQPEFVEPAVTIEPETNKPPKTHFAE